MGEGDGKQSKSTSFPPRRTPLTTQQACTEEERYSLAHKVGLKSSVVAVLLALELSLALLVLERPADDLLDDTVVQVDTRSEQGPPLRTDRDC